MMDAREKMEREKNRLRALTDDLALSEQEKRIVEWICGWDIPTVEAVAGIIEKARGSR